VADRIRAAWIAAALAAAFLAPLAFGQPYWQTVDDAIMAMVVHGYGVAGAPSPDLWYSARPYAMSIGALQTVAGLQAYGVVTYALLAAAAAAIGWALARSAARPAAFVAASLVAVFAPAALYPQFTVLAGLLALGGVMLLAAGGAFAALIGGILLALGGMVRAAEAVAVLLFSAPFWLPALRGAAGARRTAAAASLVAAAAIVAAVAVTDRAYYQRAEAWRQHVAIDAARTSLTDYGVGRYFLEHPAEAARLQLLPNDLTMMEGWFFADPRVFEAKRVAELVSLAPLVGRAAVNFGRWREALAPFFDPAFCALLLLSLVATWRSGSRAAAWTLAAFGCAMVGLWLAGRPGTTRIYTPLLAAILLFTLATRGAQLTRLGTALSVAALAFIGAMLASRNAADQAEAAKMRARLCDLPPAALYVVWAERLPYELLYRPLSAPGDGCTLRLYPLSPQSYAPYAIERLREATGKTDVVAALVAGQPLDFIADGGEVELLQRHLRLHYQRDLSWERLRGDGRRGSWYRLSVAPAGRD
jgi:hypothetical protein